jgi:hypothetical protein
MSRAAGTGARCSPLHRLSFNSRNEGSHVFDNVASTGYQSVPHVVDELPLRRRLLRARAGGSLRTSTRSGRSMTYLQGECSCRRAEEEGEVQRRSTARSQ